MITQDIKSNINKIDFDLKNLFENVYIKEKTLGNQFYFEINANSTFFNINESSDWKRAESIVKIIKSDLSSDMVKWSYSINPLNESADWIERVSNMNVIAKDIFETITKSRMDKSYFESLESIVESINESAPIEITKDDLINKLKEIAARFEVEVKKVEKTNKPVLESNEFMNNAGDTTIRLYHNSDIKVSDRFKIESEINSNAGVNWTLFKEGFIEVNLSQS
jgi:hypothetical protein